jgi:DNA-binding CsgD family transcriptional regulator
VQTGPANGSAEFDWALRLAGLFDCAGTAEFGAALDRLARQLAPYDLSAIFLYPPSGQPVLLHDGFGSYGNRRALENYVKGAYLLDAVYQACATGVADGLYRMDALAPDAFFESDYFHAWEVHPCISMNSGSLAEEVVFLATIASGRIAYSLMRANGSPRFDAAEFARLDGTAPVVMSAMRMNWDGSMHGAGPASSFGTAEQAFTTFEQGRLTDREREIVRLMLQGHSALSSSGVLGIAEGTVKNHRKSIYSKLRISSQAELFNSFLRHVLGPGGP